MRRILFVLVMSSLGMGAARAESPVHIPDPNLKAAIEEALWVSDPTPTDMLKLTRLRTDRQGITDLSGLEYATNLVELEITYAGLSDISVVSALTNLRSLILNNNHIRDMLAVSGLTNLEVLDVHNNELTDISPVSALVNLHTLYLRINYLTDISPLSGLINLEMLELRNNEIGDISPLAGLRKLRMVTLHGNRISNISVLSGLQELQEVSLSANQICDIAPLAGLTSLETLILESNPLNQDAYDIYLPQIRANNPGIRLLHDPLNKFRVFISSTTGGSVTAPGEGEFIRGAGENITLKAVADPGFTFVSWSGSYFTQQNPAMVTVDQDHRIQANFVSISGVLHVDDDAANDPGPRDSTRSNPQEDGTLEYPFDRIQEAIEMAAEGASVRVHPGTYRESLNLLGKNLQLLGIDFSDPNGSVCPVLEGIEGVPVVSFVGGEGPDCTLTGFVITRGKGPAASAILCEGASPTITNCLIVGNRAGGSNGAAIQCTRSSATFRNCTIADNHSGPQGAGLLLLDSSIGMLNSIVWDNTPNEILSLGDSAASLRYCDIRGGWPDEGNLGSDPLFAGRGAWVDMKDPNTILVPQDERAVWTDGDYHLRSQAGRWDSAASQWVQDEVSSPCLDRGDRATPVGCESAPNGGVINLGAYGGTTEASKSDSSH